VTSPRRGFINLRARFPRTFREAVSLSYESIALDKRRSSSMAGALRGSYSGGHMLAHELRLKPGMPSRRRVSRTVLLLQHLGKQLHRIPVFPFPPSPNEYSAPLCCSCCGRLPQHTLYALRCTRADASRDPAPDGCQRVDHSRARLKRPARTDDQHMPPPRQLFFQQRAIASRSRHQTVATTAGA